MGASANADRAGGPADLSRCASQPKALIPCADDLRRWHEQYGPCDGFGPLWTCSACTGIMGTQGGYRLITDGEIDETTAANAIGDFLLEKAERAALEALSCCEGPAEVADYMRRALIMDFPGEPWRHGDELFHGALALEGRDQFGNLIRDSDTSPKEGKPR